MAHVTVLQAFYFMAFHAAPTASMLYCAKISVDRYGNIVRWGYSYVFHHYCCISSEYFITFSLSRRHRSPLTFWEIFSLFDDCRVGFPMIYFTDILLIAVYYAKFHYYNAVILLYFKAYCSRLKGHFDITFYTYSPRYDYFPLIIFKSHGIIFLECVFAGLKFEFLLCRT